MNIFTPKHQRLVNQCYPKGRIPDKAPKPSESSYLIYYVSTRRTKLEKVSNFLYKKTQGDLSHSRYGNIQVTLILMDKIVQACKDNLNVFIGTFIEILSQVFHVVPLGLVLSTFDSICENLDGVVLADNQEELYQFITKCMATDDAEMQLQLGLALAKVANLASNQKLSKFIQDSVSLALTYPVPTKLRRHKTGEDANTSAQVLEAFFNTTEMDKLSVSIHSLKKTRLSYEMLEYITNLVPVQLRYLVVLILLQGSETNGVINQLLTSDVSIVGLSVIDLLRKVVKHQLDNDVGVDYTATVAALNFKTYYTEQTSDMLHEITAKLLENTTHKDVLLDDIAAILKFNQSKISMDAFSEVLPFLSVTLALQMIQDVEQRQLHLFFDKVGESPASAEPLFKWILANWDRGLVAGAVYYQEHTSDELYTVFHTVASATVNNYNQPIGIFSNSELLSIYQDTVFHDDLKRALDGDIGHHYTSVPLENNRQTESLHSTPEKEFEPESQPKVKDLKDIIRGDSASMHNIGATARDIASVRSRVTNVTMMLHDLPPLPPGVRFTQSNMSLKGSLFSVA